MIGGDTLITSHKGLKSMFQICGYRATALSPLNVPDIESSRNYNYRANRTMWTCGLFRATPIQNLLIFTLEKLV